MEQKRFLLAIMLSGLILLTWQILTRRYFPAPVQQTSQQQSPQSIPPPPSPVTAEIQSSLPPVAVVEFAPSRQITIETPLYKVTFDSRGAVAKSWVIKTNKKNGREVYSVAGSFQDRLPLELIPQREDLPSRPLQIVTNDAALNTALAQSSYAIGGASESESQITLENQTENRTLSFTLPANEAGLSVTKTLEFNSQTYVVNVKTSATRNGTPLTDARLVIGPSIGDQGINHYTFYSVAPEAVAVLGDERAVRHTAAHIEDNNANSLTLNGSVRWAAVADTYFAMAAIPTSDVQTVEYKTVKYNHEVQGVKEDRYFVSALVPLSAQSYALYVGPKDHDLLESASAYLNQTYQRAVDLDGLIDYGFGHQISRPIAVIFLRILENLYTFTKNYGIAIILLTLIIYTIFFPLKWRSSKSMKKAQKMAPRMKEIQEQLKKLKPDDPRMKELQMEQLRLFKEGNMLGGCLPMLIQMPFFFAIFRAITISLDFRQAEFLWLKDLSATDPYHLLPFLMAGSMLVVQAITPAPQADPVQRKLMLFMIPAVMLYALWSAPAGLLVYWLTGNIVLFLQQMIINRLLKKSDDEDLTASKLAQPA